MGRREREGLWFGRVGDVMRGRFPSVAPIVARAERVNPTVSSESASPKSKIKLNSLNLLGKTKTAVSSEMFRILLRI